MGIIQRKRAILLNEPHVETATGELVNINTDMIAPLKSCMVEFLPVQSGSGDPSPSNNRNVFGWAGINCKRSGKNLYDKLTADVQDRKIRNDSGVAVNDNANSYCQEMIPVKPNSIITISGFYDSGIGIAKRVYFLDEKGGWISRTSGYYSPPFSVTTPANCYYIQLQLQRCEFESWENVQVELGSISTYEAYTGTTIPVSWASVGTAYGGYVDLNTGILVSTHGYKEYDGSSDESWNVESMGGDKNNYYINISDAKANSYNDGFGAIVCNYLKQRSPNTGFVTGECFVSGTRNFNAYIGSIINVHSVANFRTWLASNNMQVAYKLQTPVTYQLTPQQLKTLVGINNIWSNANGNITVKYWTH